jgi:plasmid replication initiation protein
MAQQRSIAYEYKVRAILFSVIETNVLITDCWHHGLAHAEGPPTEVAPIFSTDASLGTSNASCRLQ